MKNRILKVFKLVAGFFPTTLPVGVKEFHSWAEDIIWTYQPAADEASVKFALCAMLMRLGPTEAYKSKRFFALCLHKGASAQIACSVMEDIKEAQRQSQLAEATALKGVGDAPNQTA